MELNVKNISYAINDDEGLTYMHFDIDDGYFSLSRLDGDDNVYLERDNQSNGQYITPDCFEFSLENTYFHLYMNLNNNRLLKYIAENKVNVELYGDTTLIYALMEKEQLLNFGEVIEKLFEF